MPEQLLNPSPTTVTPKRRHRRTLLTIESVMAVFGLAGGVMLMSERGTPPVETISALGLSSWVLPGVWLVASVAVPSSVAAYLAWRGSTMTPTAVLVASILLALELLIQIPFLGVNALQAVMALIGGAAAALAWQSRTTW